MLKRKYFIGFILIIILSSCYTPLPKNEIKYNNSLLSLKWLEKGEKYFEMQKYKKAIRFFNKAIYFEPNNEKALYLKASANYYLCQYEKAIQILDKLIALNSNLYKAWHSKSLALRMINKNEEAIQANGKALELIPQGGGSEDAYEVWYTRGLFLSMSLQFGNMIKALEAYDKALEFNPRALKVWVSKGSLLCFLNRYEQALQTYDSAIKINSNFIYFWINKGDTLMKLGRYKEAAISYEKAIELDSNNNLASEGKDDAIKNLKTIIDK